MFRIRLLTAILLALILLGTSIGTAYASDRQTASSIPDYGITFHLEKVTELKRGYLFEGTIRWTDTNIKGSVFPYGVHLRDAKGRKMQVEDVSSYSMTPGEKEIHWAFKSLKKSHAFPLRLKIDGYGFYVATEGSFSVDLGDNPQPGQTLPLNLDLSVAGYSLHVHSVTAVDDPELEAKYLQFELSSNAYVDGAKLIDVNHPPAGGGGGGGVNPWQPEPFTSNVYYNDDFPTAIIELSVEELSLSIRDPWQVTWRP